MRRESFECVPDLSLGGQDLLGDLTFPGQGPVLGFGETMFEVEVDDAADAAVTAASGWELDGNGNGGARHVLANDRLDASLADTVRCGRLLAVTIPMAPGRSSRDGKARKRSVDAGVTD